MARKMIKNLQPGDTLNTYVFIRSPQIKETSANKEFVSAMLADASGSVIAVKWSVTNDDREICDRAKDRAVIVGVSGCVEEYNGQLQVKIKQMKLAAEDQKIDLSSLVRVSGSRGDDMDTIVYAVENIQDPDFKKACEYLCDCEEFTLQKLRDHPGAKSVHHGYCGGLVQHIAGMLKAAKAINEVYAEKINYDLLCTGIIFHDLGKLAELRADAYGNPLDYSVEGELLGHTMEGYAFASKVCESVGMPKAKRIALLHLIAAHHDRPDWGAGHAPQMLEAVFLHLLDRMDATANSISEELKKSNDIRDGFIYTGRLFSQEGRKFFALTDQEPPEEAGGDVNEV